MNIKDFFERYTLILKNPPKIDGSDEYKMGYKDAFRDLLQVLEWDYEDYNWIENFFGKEIMNYQEWLKENENRLMQEYLHDSNKKTLVCFLLDRSGSMAGKQNDVIGGVNEFLAKQKLNTNPCSISFFRFDTGGTERFRDTCKLEDCKDLNADDFIPRGGTPLFDAIGNTITAIEKDILIQMPAKTIFVIVTDGEENASYEFNKEKIKALIEYKEKNNWAFIYLGADVNAFQNAGGIGIRACNTAQYAYTNKGVHSMYAQSLDANISYMRNTLFSTACTLNIVLDEDGK
jgi:uncharacterized protein YegL